MIQGHFQDLFGNIDLLVETVECLPVVPSIVMVRQSALKRAVRDYESMPENFKT